ncbi:response regulator transcription factor [Yersinia alsatica]|uniref:response regulator transcription factor n=1 Tax=Yersinia alsatica TaxID=2890317 RepID=UPI00119CE9F4|nr:LuxR C-terminal-related transcriptional regulator [Yersinia alsatica]
MKKTRNQLTPEFDIIDIDFDSMFIKKIHNFIYTTTSLELISIVIIKEVSFSKNEIYLITPIINKVYNPLHLEKIDIYLKSRKSNKDETCIFKNYSSKNNNQITKSTEENKENTSIAINIDIKKNIFAIVSLLGNKSKPSLLNHKDTHTLLGDTSLKLINNIFTYIEKNKKNSHQKNNNELYITSVEVDILRYSADGFTSKEIADKIFLSKSCVDFHLVSLKRKLKCRNKTQVIAKAISLCLI